MPIPRRNLIEAFATARQQGLFQNDTLSSFSERASQLTGDNTFDAGKLTGFSGVVADLSAGLDEILDRTGVRDFGGDVGEGIGEFLFDAPDIGRMVGEELPRGLINTAPLFAGPAGIPVSAALFGSQGLENTGSLLRGGIAGTTGVLAPFAIGKMTGPLLGKVLPDAATKLMSQPAIGVPSRVTGNLIDSFAVDVATDVADIAVAPERRFGELLTPEYWQARSIANLSFVPFDIHQAYKAQFPKSSEARNDIKQSVLDGTEDGPVGAPIQDRYSKMARADDDLTDAFDSDLLALAQEEADIRAGIGKVFGESPTTDDLSAASLLEYRQRAEEASQGIQEQFDAWAPADAPRLTLDEKKILDVRLHHPDGIPPQDANGLAQPTSDQVVKITKDDDGNYMVVYAIDGEEYLGYMDDPALEFHPKYQGDLNDKTKSGPTMRNLETRADTAKEFQKQVKETNTLRPLVDLPFIDDNTLNTLVNRFVNDGMDSDTALIRSIQKLKNQTQRELNKLKDFQGSDDVQNALAQFRAVAEVQPELKGLINRIESALIKHPDDPTLVNDIREIANDAISNQGRLIRPGKEFEYKSIGDDIHAAVKRANARRTNLTKEKKKAGRKTNIKPEDLETVWAEVEALPKKDNEMIMNSFSRFMEAASGYNLNGSEVFAFSNEVVRWLNLPNERRTHAAFKKMTAAKLKRMKDDFNRQKAARGVENDPEQWYQDGESADAWDVDDHLSTYDENEWDPMLINAVDEKTLNNSQFLLGLDTMIKRDDETGQYFIGSEKFPLSKNGTVPEATVVKLLNRHGLPRAVWDSLKKGYSVLQRTDGLVHMNTLVNILNEGNLINIKHDLGNSNPYAADDRRFGEIVHEIDTQTGNDLVSYGITNYIDFLVRGSANPFHDVQDNLHLENDLMQQVHAFVEDPNNKALLDEAVEIKTRQVEAERDANMGFVDEEMSENFTQMYASVAPDAPADFNPTTGLGNTSVRVLVKGLHYIGHPPEADALGWVRGKFIEHNGERIYRVDELQSDAAQNIGKQDRKTIETLEEVANKGGADTTIHDIVGLEGERLRTGDQGLMRMLSKQATPENIYDVINYYKQRIKNERHPLLDHSNTILLRAAITHARKFGVNKIFLPDANTAMLTEGHDRAASMVKKVSLETVFNEISPHEADLMIHYGDDWRKGTYAKVEVPGRPNQTRIVRVDPDAPKPTNSRDRIAQEGVRETFHWDNLPTAGQLVEPKMAGGMREAYNRRVPRSMDKLLGQRPKFVNLGEHINTPFSTDPNVFGEPVYTENFGFSPDQNRLSKRRKELEEIYPPSEYKIFVEDDFRVFKIPSSEKPVAIKKPVFYNDYGKPHTEITGRLYDLTNAPDKFPLLGRRLPYDPQFILREILANQGHTPSEGLGLTPSVLRTVKAIEELLGQPVQAGRLVNDPSGRVAGLASKTGNEILLNLSNPEDVVRYTAMHEGAHLLKNAYERNQLPPDLHAAYEKFNKFAHDLTSPEDRRLFMEMFGKELLPPKLYKKLASTLGKNAESPSEFMSDVMAGLSWASINEADPYTKLRFLPQPVLEFAIKTFEWMKDVWKAVKSYGLYKRINQQYGKEVTGTIRDLEKIVTKQFRDIRLQEHRAKKEFGDLYGVMPGGREGREVDVSVLDIGDNGLVNEYADFMLLKGVGKKLGELAEPILPRLARFPALQSTAQWILHESNMSNMITRTGLKALFGAGETRGGTLKVAKDGGPAEFVMKNEKANQAISEIMIWEQMKAGNDFLTKRGSELYEKLLDGLSPEERRNVLEALPRFRELGQLSKQMIKNFDMELLQAEGAIWLREKVDLPQRDVENISKQLFDLYNKGRAEGDLRRYFDLAKIHGIDGKDLALLYEPGLKAISRKMQKFNDMGHWVNFRRWKRFHVSFNRNDGTINGRRDFNTREEAAEFVEEAKEKGWKVFYPGPGYRDMHQRLGFKDPGRRFIDLNDVAQERTVGADLDNLLKEGVISDTVYNKLQQAREDGRREFQAERIQAEIGKLDPSRRFSPGFEDLNMPEQHLKYLTMLSKVLPRKVTNAWMNFEEMSPDIQNSPRNQDAFEQAKQHLKNFRTPDTDAGRKITMGNFTWYMWMNISTALIESSQFPMSLSPILTREGASLTQSYLLPFKAIKNIIKWNTSGKWNSGFKVKLNNGKVVDAYQLAHDRAIDTNRLGLGRQQEAREAFHESMMDYGRMANGEAPLGVKQAKDVWNQMFNIGQKVYGFATGFNTQIGIFSGMELAKAKSPDLKDKKVLTQHEFDQIYNAGDGISAVANHDAGRIGRPTGWFNSEGGWRTFSQATWSLQNYNAGLLSNIYTNLKRGFGKVEGLSKHERRQAQKATIQAFTTMMLGAGLIGGVPFAGAVMTILDEHTELEPRLALREFLNEIGGEEYGTTLADFATHGAAYAAGLPFDMSGRLALGGMLGFNEFEGWSVKSLLGPTVNRYGDYATAVKNYLQGDITEGVENSLPGGLRKLWTTWSDQGEIKDSTGRTIVKPSDTERTLMAIGFQPRSIAMSREVQRMQYTAERVRREKNQRVYKKAAKISKEKGMAAARNYLNAYAQEDPNFSIRAAVEAVADFNTRSEFGMDPRYRASLQASQQNQRILNTFDQSELPRVSQPQLAQRRAASRLGLGVDPGNIPNQMLTALLGEVLGQQLGLPPTASRFVAGQLSSPSPESGDFPLLQAFLQGGP